jgi:multiple antibiotic resistance protein
MTGILAMYPDRPTMHRGVSIGRLARRLGMYAIAATCVGYPGAAHAATVATAAAASPYSGQAQYPVAQIFTFMFLTLGPFKIIGPFAEVTRGADARLTRRIALMATLYASLALLFAAVVGGRLLDSYGISVPLLALSGGLILFLVALINILKQFEPPASRHAGPTETPPPPPMSVAMTPLAFPTIVTPYGIAALVVFLALGAEIGARMTVVAVIAVIMLLNLAVMLFSRRFMAILGVILPILGAVLGIVQVALGLKIINNALIALGVL